MCTALFHHFKENIFVGTEVKEFDSQKAAELYYQLLRRKCKGIDIVAEIKNS